MATRMNPIELLLAAAGYVQQSQPVPVTSAQRVATGALSGVAASAAGGVETLRGRGAVTWLWSEVSQASVQAAEQLLLINGATTEPSRMQWVSIPDVVGRLDVQELRDLLGRLQQRIVLQGVMLRLIEADKPKRLPDVEFANTAIQLCLERGLMTLEQIQQCVVLTESGRPADAAALPPQDPPPAKRRRMIEGDSAQEAGVVITPEQLREIARREMARK